MPSMTFSADTEGAIVRVYPASASFLLPLPTSDSLIAGRLPVGWSSSSHEVSANVNALNSSVAANRIVFFIVSCYDGRKAAPALLNVVGLFLGKRPVSGLRLSRTKPVPPAVDFNFRMSVCYERIMFADGFKRHQ